MSEVGPWVHAHGSHQSHRGPPPCSSWLTGQRKGLLKAGSSPSEGAVPCSTDGVPPKALGALSEHPTFGAVASRAGIHGPRNQGVEMARAPSLSPLVPH